MSATVVVKYGGNAMGNEQALDKFASAIAAVRAAGYRVVVVHGGGPQISYWLEKTNQQSHFIDGQRYTDADALAVVEMALCGQVNKALVRALDKAGIVAVGVSGEDGGLLKATQNPKLGAVGEINSVNPKLLDDLLDCGWTPIIAPLACDSTQQALNINADYSAAHIAAALSADDFILMTNVSGVLDKQGERLASLDGKAVRALIDEGVIYGGMLPKVDCALTALRGGAQHSAIIDGTHPELLLDALRERGSVGTVFTH
ncbi:acetylglutamate kinase [Suttonella sp. R2A3]|uniref:acetylglutamate kinase n=1 Tax=Suttonella sp. R2A3 TaxID=2908648 RepID=UPI001F3248E8|nr:acetylglutamate kinase [Suttonella sp. R2A3]UJF23736.1 acetylglutamate kinase [Suttonella sp. R2A3]